MELVLKHVTFFFILLKGKHLKSSKPPVAQMVVCIFKDEYVFTLMEETDAFHFGFFFATQTKGKDPSQ
jgi:hypothetical protein